MGHSLIQSGRVQGPWLSTRKRGCSTTRGCVNVEGGYLARGFAGYIPSIQQLICILEILIEWMHECEKGHWDNILKLDRYTAFVNTEEGNWAFKTDSGHDDLRSKTMS